MDSYSPCVTCALAFVVMRPNDKTVPDRIGCSAGGATPAQRTEASILTAAGKPAWLATRVGIKIDPAGVEAGRVQWPVSYEARYIMRCASHTKAAL